MPRRLPFDAIALARDNWVKHDLEEPDAMAAATSIMRAQQIVMTAVESALKPLGLSFARWEVLVLLSFSKRGSLPMTKVGERLMVHPTGITRLVDKLEANRLVERRPDPDDRRTTLAAITPEGRRLARRGAKAVGAVRFGAHLPDPQLRQLTELLTALRLARGDFTAG